MWGELQRNEAERQRHHENRGRLAWAWGRGTSKGQGTVEFAQPIRFHMTFLERPFVSYGNEMDVDELRITLGVDDDAPVFGPIASGFVAEWMLDDRDHYIGAWCGVSVHYPPDPALAPVAPGQEPPAPTPGYLAVTDEITLRHHFGFAGVALKAVPPGEDDE